MVLCTENRFITLLSTMILLKKGWSQTIPYKPGDRCDKTVDCGASTDSGLVCFLPTSRCGCLHDPHAQFNFLASQCEISANNKCEFNGVPATCTTNAACTNGLCQCAPPFSVTPSGKCVMKFNETCSTDTHCNAEEFLICQGGRCECDLNLHARYEPHLQKCVITLNANCDPSEYTPPCQLYSDCVKQKPGDQFGKCQCKHSLLPNGNDECVHGFNESCALQPRDSCNSLEFLKCGNGSGRCECYDPRTQFYDAEDKVCKIYAGQTCTKPADSKTPSCRDFSYCEQNPSALVNGPVEGNLICVCQQGTMESNSKACVLPYGSICDLKKKLEPDCDGESFQECDRNTYTCGCKDGENSWYDPNTKKCFLLEGARCTPRKLDRNDQRCGPNSECLPDGKGQGICTCLDTFQRNSERKCGLQIGSKCKLGVDLCDKNAFLECNATSLLCNCKAGENILFQENTQSCLIKASHECNMNLAQQACVQNSKCKPSGPNGISFCTCDDGLEPGISGNCVRAWGESCQINGFGPELCDANGFQICGPLGGCECMNPANMTFDPKEKLCRLKINSSCPPGSPPCDHGLVCEGQRCECDKSKGFMQDSAGKCSLEYGRACGPSDLEAGGVDMPLECNKDLFLGCSSDGRCKCLESHDAIVLETGSWTRCLGKFNAVCEKNNDCQMNNSMVCSPSGICECYEAEEQYFDLERGKCLGKRGGRCHINVNAEWGNDPVPMECGKGLFCQKSSHPFYGSCECDWKNLESGSKSMCV